MDESLLIRIILLSPLLMAAFNGMMGVFVPSWRTREPLVGWLATAAVALPFACTVALFIPMAFGGHPEAHVVTYFPWLRAGELAVDFSYRIDQLSVLMTLIVTGVGSLIHVYSVGYMHGDPGYWRFFAYLNLFIFAMLNLVLAENLVVLFLGWEGVGLCSYLLIGFWYTELNNAKAANKAFIVNRIGDFAFLIALFILFDAVTGVTDGGFGLDFSTLLAPDTVALLAEQDVVFWAVVMLFIGATGKSAQIPLFTWLPDAMAGPTPVSALIHAATMVTSGLYLLARLSPIVLESPEAMGIVAAVGAVTAIMAASVAVTQNDIKKVLAYSTVSQLGYMFLAAGVGAFFVAIFHVMTHAFFKACLFLGSGSVIHAMHDVEHELEHRGVIPKHANPQGTPLDSESAEPTLRSSSLPYDGPFDAQDMRTMGGLRKHMPTTAITFLIATLAIAGFPLLAGFFSKDEILFFTYLYGVNDHAPAYLLYGVGLLTALLTAVYMGRCYLLTFEGRPRWPSALDVKPHESPWTMTMPLAVLAFLSLTAGFLGVPEVMYKSIPLLPESWIHHWLGSKYGGPVAELSYEQEAGTGTAWGLLLLGAGAGLAGLGIAYARWGRKGLEADVRLRERLGGLYGVLARKWYWDEGYDAAVVRPIEDSARKRLAPFDQRGIDGAVNGLARAVRGASDRGRLAQTGVVQTYALSLVLGVVLVVALILFA